MAAVKKHSKKRDAILKCITGTDTHPTAEWIYSKLKPDIPDLSLATVYRNLSQFRNEGKIVSIATVNGLERYDGNIGPHAHFICESCGRITDLPDICVPEESIKTAESAMEGTVSGYRLTFIGICNSCRQMPDKE